MRLKSAEYRQGERPEWLCHRRVGGRIPLPRTGGAPARADRIVEELAAGVKVSWHYILIRLGGGRTWWAHFAFTRINIAPTILYKKIEDVLELGASKSIDRCTNLMTMFRSPPTLRRSARADEAPHHAAEQRRLDLTRRDRDGRERVS